MTSPASKHPRQDAPVRRRAPWWLLPNSDGRKDGAWTIAVVTLVPFWLGMLLGGSEWSEAGGLVLRMPPPGETSIAAIITAVGAYVLRRRARDKAMETDR